MAQSRRRLKKALTSGRFRRLVSGNFLVGPKGRTVTKHEMMELGLPVKRIEWLCENLPLLQVGPRAYTP